MGNTRVVMAITVAAGICLMGATPKPVKPAAAPAAAPAECSPSTAKATVSSQTIVGQQAARLKGLTSYQVPLDISTKVRLAFALVPVKLGGTQFFKSPAQVAVQVKAGRKEVAGLIEAIDSLAALQVPLKTSQFEIDPAKLKTVTNPDCSKDYELEGTLSGVSDVVFKVNTVTYVIDEASLTYADGGTLDAKYAFKTVKDTKNSYYMLSTMTVAAKLQSYKGNASVSYGDYVLNGSIPATVFAP
jgi:soluble cytochrome b562